MWKHTKKYKNIFYKGNYELIKGERQLRLTALSGKKHTVVFESHESAKKNGWIKV